MFVIPNDGSTGTWTKRRQGDFDFITSTLAKHRRPPRFHKTSSRRSARTSHMQIVGISLVRNEERFVRQALLNVADFCDRIVVADHLSTDRTPADSRGALEAARQPRGRADLALGRVACAHRGARGYGDLGAFGRRRRALRPRRTSSLPRRPRTRRTRRRVPGPPGGPPLRLAGRRGSRGVRLPLPAESAARRHLNFAAVDSWSGVRSERLHGGDIRFRSGYDLDSWRHLGAEHGWDGSPFRALHMCFLERSSADPREAAPGRPNLAETRRSAAAPSARSNVPHDVCPARAPARARAQWKAEKYRRGDRVTVDVCILR